MKVNNIFEELPDKLPEEFFENLIENENFKLERIVSEGHSTPEGEWYDQQTNEFIILLKGKAKLIFENDEDVILHPGDHLIIPKQIKHRVEWTSDTERTFWLALHY
jgi:cupin 2 domain-containing protein